MLSNIKRSQEVKMFHDGPPLWLGILWVVFTTVSVIGGITIAITNNTGGAWLLIGSICAVLVGLAWGILSSEVGKTPRNNRFLNYLWFIGLLFLAPALFLTSSLIVAPPAFPTQGKFAVVEWPNNDIWVVREMVLVKPWSGALIYPIGNQEFSVSEKIGQTPWKISSFLELTNDRTEIKALIREYGGQARWFEQVRAIFNQRAQQVTEYLVVIQTTLSNVLDQSHSFGFTLPQQARLKELGFLPTATVWAAREK